MRILHIFSFLSPNANGTITLTRQLSLALAQRGHEVGVFTSDFELSKEYIDSLKPVKIYAYPSWLNLKRLYLYPSPGMISEAKRIIRDFDIVHLHCFRSLQNMVVCHYAKKYGIPYVVDAHGSVPIATEGKKGLKWLLRKLFDVFYGYNMLKGSSKVIAETEVGIREYEELGVKKEKIVLIPPPFSVDEFSQLPAVGQFRSKYDIGEKHIIMFMGRINQIKGLDFLVESFYQLTQLRNDVILAIIGPDDGYKSALDDLIDRLNLSEKVLFTGFLGGEQKLSALVDADVFAQTSRYEQGAWAPFEAVLCGTPIIVTGHTGAGEDVKRLDAGSLVEFGNRKELAELILRILEDPAEAESKANKAAKYIRENMSITKRIEDYEKLYVKCIEENKQLARDKK